MNGFTRIYAACPLESTLYEVKDPGDTLAQTQCQVSACVRIKASFLRFINTL